VCSGPASAGTITADLQNGVVLVTTTIDPEVVNQ
jgi:hypothetical protein